MKVKLPPLRKKSSKNKSQQKNTHTTGARAPGAPLAPVFCVLFEPKIGGGDQLIMILSCSDKSWRCAKKTRLVKVSASSIRDLLITKKGGHFSALFKGQFKVGANQYHFFLKTNLLNYLLSKLGVPFFPQHPFLSTLALPLFFLAPFFPAIRRFSTGETPRWWIAWPDVDPTLWKHRKDSWHDGTPRRWGPIGVILI